MSALVVGPRGSGKSALAEGLLLRRDAPIHYVATLPSGLDTSNRIARHARRRDERWQVYELVGHPQTDLTHLRRVLDGVEPVLVDGLFLLVARLSEPLGDAARPRPTATLIEALAAMFATARSEWVVVDPPPAALAAGGLQKLAEELARLHRGLVGCGASRITLPPTEQRGAS